VPAFADDPELAAVLADEVDERIAALGAGLLAWEGTGTREALTALLRDAHTVKGSARLLAADEVVELAHAAEEVLGRLQQQRGGPGIAAAVDALLAATDGMRRAAAGERLGAAAVAALCADLAGGGAAAPTPPRQRTAAPAAGGFVDATFLASGPAAAEPPDAARPAPTGPAPAGDSVVRLRTVAVQDVLRTVGEVELGARRVQAATERLVTSAQRVADASRGDRPDAVAVALAELAAAAELARPLAEDHRDGAVSLREGSTRLTMVPLERCLAQYPRMVRSVAQAAGKRVRWEVLGGAVAVDARVLDGLSEALTHLVTNAVDHGCEPPEVREAAGKPAEATITLRARAAGTRLVLELTDDGAGIDVEAVGAAVRRRGLDPVGRSLLALLTLPELSTAAAVTRTSGRGVGLDAVARGIRAMGGSLAVRTERGRGTTFTVDVPLDRGVLHCLVARVGSERYAVPFSQVVETLALPEQLGDLAGTPVVVHADRVLPVLPLGERIGAGGSPRYGVLTETAAGPVVASVDALLGERQCVVRPLGRFLDDAGVPGVSGATLDDDGAVLLVVDLEHWCTVSAGAGRAAAAGSPVPPDRTEATARVLVVEDSRGVRLLEERVLTAAGYAVETCEDGTAGLERLAGAPADCVVTDVDMPGCDGFALTRAIRAHAAWAGVPVVIMTSRGSEDDTRAGLEAGADAYLRKSGFDERALVATVRRLVGR
jgi:chemotaxis protein histidine kinase CheA